ncbi:hypothetical protein SLEP1_g4001 [Rubroshorea leprosula]|uniref:Uncharacterized protein n=1 Tax=Rubroshorea leprosula TaxID=152421 RepID=A0AAV5HMA0_9ROSI|nr:hypothetical protein SLEP1_g4001 [Rubroshorea leprosula]
METTKKTEIAEQIAPQKHRLIFSVASLLLLPPPNKSSSRNQNWPHLLCSNSPFQFYMCFFS